MASNAFHHVALRVSDLDRSTRFYEQVFGGTIEFERRLEPEFVETIFGVRASCVNRMISFGSWALEIFVFERSEPFVPADQAKIGLMHVCAWVEDVPGTVELVRRAGGRPLFPTLPWSGHHFVYVEDPDGNVIELLDATHEQIGELLERVGLPDYTLGAG